VSLSRSRRLGYGAAREKQELTRVLFLGAGPQGEHFANSSLLILINRIFAIGLGLAVVAWTNRGRREPLSRALAPKSPLKQVRLAVGLYCSAIAEMY
jgi:hypothetical protein